MASPAYSAGLERYLDALAARTGHLTICSAQNREEENVGRNMYTYTRIKRPDLAPAKACPKRLDETTSLVLAESERRIH